jgi:hypothetical protein
MRTGTTVRMAPVWIDETNQNVSSCGKSAHDLHSRGIWLSSLHIFVVILSAFRKQYHEIYNRLFLPVSLHIATISHHCTPNIYRKMEAKLSLHELLNN